MDSYDDNITKPNKKQGNVVHWMINDKKGGFNYDTLHSKGSPRQFVSITKQEMEGNKELKDAGWEMGNINVRIGGKDVIFVNVQAQIGVLPNRPTFSHANVVADKKVGKSLIQQAMNESMGDQQTRWIVEEPPGKYKIQSKRPG
ncbi:hypothetical protein MANI_025829 [Metarhizium anisopliae]|uniref:Uncharacterized protein n=1 Tax=Metarhizium anisopliae BRIP 53293 TaxID=1291518 RepID=A0A0D9P0K3_METAN|nr:hypothetical protein MANI_025829 [Metarhizium anisopliae]KJK79606.1 hypothetical protein H634G_05198 [Metarhizium anisopliae BRIP 53293]KJK90615.1 hypothetical protein H633G_05523 [Metarhizium anisopliae BRIP 53284]